MSCGTFTEDDLDPTGVIKSKALRDKSLWMNPNISTNWPEIAFSFLMTAILGFQLWRGSPARANLIGKIGVLAIVLAFAGGSVANLFYQRALNVRAWPTNGIFDQVLVTKTGDVFVKVNAPVIGRADRVQRYSCRGEFKAAFAPNSAGGLFKIMIDPDGTLSIYSVRTDSIDTFKLDGTFLRRRAMDSHKMPFRFLEDGPSVTEVNGCAFIMDPVTGRPAVKDSSGVWRLERGDWVLEYVLNQRNIVASALVGALLWLISYFSMRNRMDLAGS